MKTLKRLTTLVGIVAIAASTLMAPGVAAQTSIGTTITVEDSNPGCQDAQLSFLDLTAVGGPVRSFGTLTYNSSIPSFNGVGAGNGVGSSVLMDLYVNQCITTWSVTATATDFQSGSNIVPSAGKLTMFARSGGAYTLPVRWSGVGDPSYSTSNQVPGTTGLPLAGSSWGVAFLPVAGGGSVGAQTVSRGGGTAQNPVPSTGRMAQLVSLRLDNVPNTTPAGVYSAELTFTFNGTQP